MEVGEMDRKEPQVEVPWIPTTLIKPVSLKPVPIYTPGEAESRNSSVTLQGNNDRLKNPFVPSFIHDNAQDPQETYIACYSKRTSQDTPFTFDNANKEESRQIASMLINMEEEDPGGEERNVCQ
ncbi:ROS isoform X3 [Spatholobus suberectus]|nr:ROS isoform X3 [Spatholobus suberectus]